jgi:hypothetical protein
VARFLAVDDLGGWKIKTYGVAGAALRPRPELLATARLRALAALPARPDRVGAFGVGFLIVHDGPGRCLVLLHWWVRPDTLHQRAFATPTDTPRELAPLASAAIGAVSDLVLTDHERAAWMRHVLVSPNGPDVDRYLADVFPATVPA